MKHTLGQAAKECGVSKSTLSRWIKKGRVSAERQEDGSFLIDASELNRIKELQQKAVACNDLEPPLQRSGTPSATPASQLEIDMMREQIQNCGRTRSDSDSVRERQLKICGKIGMRGAFKPKSKPCYLPMHQEQAQVKPTLWKRVFSITPYTADI